MHTAMKLTYTLGPQDELIIMEGQLNILKYLYLSLSPFLGKALAKDFRKVIWDYTLSCSSS